ncbi:hypothetical protein Droror1_Dr00017912, partial [Drosera rotundifolia]
MEYQAFDDLFNNLQMTVNLSDDLLLDNWGSNFDSINDQEFNNVSQPMDKNASTDARPKPNEYEVETPEMFNEDL